MNESPDVPRDVNGWPTIDPKFFTEKQLRIEAENWRSTASQAEHENTVACTEWVKYSGELVRRGFIKTARLSEKLI